MKPQTQTVRKVISTKYFHFSRPFRSLWGTPIILRNTKTAIEYANRNKANNFPEELSFDIGNNSMDDEKTRRNVGFHFQHSICTPLLPLDSERVRKFGQLVKIRMGVVITGQLRL